jgi:hypothetical protein
MQTKHSRTSDCNLSNQDFKETSQFERFFLWVKVSEI